MLSGPFLQSCFLARQSPAPGGPWADLRDSGLCLPLNSTPFFASMFLQVVEVSLGGKPAFQHVPYSPRFYVIWRLSESAFCVLVHVGGVKQTALSVNIQRMSLKTDHPLIPLIPLKL